MADWLAAHPALAGVVTFVLMWTDWMLTVLQHRERQRSRGACYRSYPVDTVEGSPLLRRAVESGRAVSLRHMVAASLLSVAVALGLGWIPMPARTFFLGYVWGIFLVVDCSHLANLLGYLAGRRGMHGEIWIHQRTGYLVQAGRYAALAALLGVLAVGSASPFVAGVAVAGIVSSLRQVLWLRRVPAIPHPDLAPSGS